MDGWIDRFLPLLPPHCLSLAVSPILKGCVEVRSVDLTASRREKEKAGWGEGEGGTRESKSAAESQRARRLEVHFSQRKPIHR